MKRKNGLRTCSRRSADDQITDGVDLNRNFGFQWGYTQEAGSSGRGCDEEYRGAAAFSEPETRAVRDVMDAHAVRAVLHWHGWGNSLAYPFAYDWHAPLPSAELERYQELSRAMTSLNGYSHGRAWESVGYHANGEADDWGYGTRGLLSMSLEVGSSRDGFWPSPARIGTLSAATLWPALTFAHRAAAVLQLHSLQLQPLPPSDEMGGDGTGEAGAGNGRTGVWLQLNVHNAGLADPPARWRLCVQAPGGWAHMLPAAEWRSGGQVEQGPANASQLRRCAELFGRRRRPRQLRGLARGEAWRLPPLGIIWQRTGAKPWLRLALSFEPVGDLSAAAAALIAPPRLLEVATDRKTLSVCDDLCFCAAPRPAESSGAAAPWAASTVQYARSCRAARPEGSVCGKPAVAQRSPANRASGTANQFFAYTPSRGAARCTVSASHLGLVLVVYRSCGRLGPQQPVGFGNTERRRTLRVSVPCESGQPLFIYWSAEYAPGSFLFAVSEEPGSSAHRHRAL